MPQLGLYTKQSGELMQLFNMSIRNKKIIVILVIIALFFTVNIVSAGSLSDFMTNVNDTAGDKGAGYNVGGHTVDSVIASIIQVALSLLGVIFLILMIYGGYLWMTDRGNAEQVEKAKKVITAAIIGLVIVIAAYAISYFVFSRLASSALK